jgi:alkylation response protein AidB-like acyl-CoA dehydrogenase
VGVTLTTQATSIQDRVGAVAADWARDRGNRQRRRELHAEDFERLQKAGFLLTGIPTELGGLWESTAASTRPICEVLRTLAGGDSSVALVSAMHPAVLSFWLASPEAPAPFADAWRAQRSEVFESARAGSWWGTITSEPGSGGDVANTRTEARLLPDGAGYSLTGQKHFGSGSGITSYMLTSGLAEGDAEPEWFFLDVRNVPWDGSTGMKLIAPWDGHGMPATQSHAFQFEDFPATRFAWAGAWRTITEANGTFIGCAFTAVIVGIVQTALEAARRQVQPRAESLREYERLEWARAELEGWLINQAYEGMLRAVEQDARPAPSVIRGKIAIAELAESVLTRICKVIGGGVYARQSPFGFWYEDVRALGFLRPPWGLAFDRLVSDALTPPTVD